MVLVLGIKSDVRFGMMKSRNQCFGLSSHSLLVLVQVSRLGICGDSTMDDELTNLIDEGYVRMIICAVGFAGLLIGGVVGWMICRCWW